MNQTTANDAETGTGSSRGEAVWNPNEGAAWTGPLWVIALGMAGLLAVYWQTAGSMLAIWWRSDTFAHGFLIPIITLYLVWERRSALARLYPRPDLVGGLVFLGLAFGWLLGRLVDVLVVEQLALVGMIVAMVWAVLGRRIAGEIAFPLGYLFFAVPIGEFLIYPMMDFTAVFLVRMLELTGIPVYWEGTFISIPSGDWSIVEGCSGVRYIIASIAVGTLYAYLFYRSLWRRLAFIALAIVTPVIANGLRAYMIVMIGHLSDMRLATGVDHLIYGWLFFGLVIMLMFWIGSFWWDGRSRSEDSAEVSEERVSRMGAPLTRISSAAFLVLLVAAIGPIATAGMKQSTGATDPRLPAPEVVDGWREEPTALTDWQPHYLGATAKLVRTYRKGDRRVALYLYYYQGQRQGAELINSQNVLVVQKDPRWQNRGDVERESDVADGPPGRVRETVLRSAAQRLMVWDWYLIDGTTTVNGILAKLLEAKAALLRSGAGSAAVMLVAETAATEDEARDDLRAFVEAMSDSIQAVLRRRDAGVDL